MPDRSSADALEQRVGRIHLRLRQGIEAEHGADIFHLGANIFHLENWYSSHAIIRFVLKAIGLYRRGVRNALDIRIRRNTVTLQRLPESFRGFRILQLSDLHLDMHAQYPEVLIQHIQNLEYDLCVITGDYRARTSGSIEQALQAMAQLRPALRSPVYGILGNHDSISMLPGLEALDIRMLVNESAPLVRDGDRLWLVGIDDPHYFQLENFEKAADDIPADEATILLSHSPEPYRRAAHSGFDLMLCGHTHGGQVCLPGGIPLLTNANAPRKFCAGTWEYGSMQGYTSVGSGSSIVDVRFNCPPEITLHTLSAAG